MSVKRTFLSLLKKIRCLLLVVGFVVMESNSIKAKDQGERERPVLRHAAGMKAIGVQGGMSSRELGGRVLLDAGYLHTISFQSRLWLATEWTWLRSSFYQNVSLSYLLSKTVFSNHKSFDVNVPLGVIGVVDTFKRQKRIRTSFNTGVLLGLEIEIKILEYVDFLLGGGSMFFVLKNRDIGRWNHYVTAGIKFSF
jgi:hypothetical protein